MTTHNDGWTGVDLRFARKEKLRMSQNDLALALGFTRQGYAKIEKRLVIPKYVVLAVKELIGRNP